MASKPEDYARASVRVIASSHTWLEGTAVEQLKKTATLPGMRLAVGLPDLHPGKGSPIGAAYLTTGTIHPALVGNDIGCGVSLYQTTLSALKPKREAWADRLDSLEGPWDGDVAELLRRRQITPTAHDASLGTIGGGNHFAELQLVQTVLDPSHGISAESVYLCVHSGSRGLGESILSDHVRKHAANGLPYPTAAASEYLNQHDNALRWARLNRELIAKRIFDCLNADGKPVSDIHHNWVEPIDFQNEQGWLHRKGAAPSTAGLVVIPGSRGALTYLVNPLAASEFSAWSLAHGAGRKWSRSDSRGRLEKRFSAKQLARTDLGSIVICEDKDLLYEEAPQAYKNIDQVIDDLVQAKLIEVVAILKPLVTYKVRR